MQLIVDARQRVEPTASSAEPSNPWILGRIAADDDAFEAEVPPYSFFAECECPGDCLRDHENE
jgi:hypothetical protein